MSNKKLSLAILGLLLLSITIFSLTVGMHDQSGETVNAKGDSLKQAGQNTVTSGNAGAVTISSQGNMPPPQADNRIPVMNEPVNKINEIPVSEAKPKRRIKNEPKYPVQKPAEMNEAATPPETKPTEKKEIQINSQVMVNLALIGTPDMNQKKKQTQRVNFSVTRPVYYNGVLIIRQGATASGSLTIGMMMTDIAIDQVEGVHGTRIPLKSERAHGKRNDITSNKTYNAIVLPGTRINFK